MSTAVDWASGTEAHGLNEEFVQGGAKGCDFSMFSAKLDDSPMFRKQIQSLEESAELLRDRCLKFYKGCRKYTEGLGEGYDGDIAFASSLEMFGGGHSDPVSVAFGGPIMTKFTIAMREIGTYKEVLRSQAEDMLNDRLLQFVEIYLNDVKDTHKRFEKASLLYDQARERYLSLKKGAKADTVAVLEDELHRARSSFEEARFNLVTALLTIEAKKRYEFLEAVSGTMHAHLHYFRQCYELLHQMEPYIHQVQAYVQQSREMCNHEQAALVDRIQDFKRQIDRESKLASNGSHDSSYGDGIQATGRNSYQVIDAVMQSAANGKVETIRQGYLSKRSSNLRGDWKRRFFVLDSRGLLYYYRKELHRRSGSGLSGLWGHSEHGSGLLSRWFSSHYHGGPHNEKPAARHTVNLLTSTIKPDADQSDLRFCFRIISPTRNYTLQAESSADQMDWIEKITGVIASLLSSQLLEQPHLATPRSYGLQRAASASSSFSSSCDLDHSVNDELLLERKFTGAPFGCSDRSSKHHTFSSKHEKPVDLLRKVHGNDFCVDCGAPGPDWASLNLGVLICIVCSGIHRNLGVHISKVRSLTLDVRAWEPSVINLFQSLGNTFANSVWEQHLQQMSNGKWEDPSLFMLDKNQEQLCSSKPKQSDPISVKEKFIHAKYADKHFISRQQVDILSVAQQLWHSVSNNDKKAVYQYIVTSNVDINFSYQESTVNVCLSIPKAMLVQEKQIAVPDHNTGFTSGNPHDIPSTISYLHSSSMNSDEKELDECFEGFTLLHLACWTADIGMIELLLQYGADLNSVDLSRRTPLHHCVLTSKHSFAKLLLSRGADPHATDENGKTPLQYAIEFSNTEDNKILDLLKRVKESD